MQVTSILYLVSSSAFDMTLVEDRRTNRLEESLNIFNVIANNRCFRNASMVLFLNKADLLAEKVSILYPSVSLLYACVSLLYPSVSLLYACVHGRYVK